MYCSLYKRFCVLINVFTLAGKRWGVKACCAQKREMRVRSLTDSRPKETFYHVCICRSGFALMVRWQWALRTWVPQSTLSMHFKVIIVSRNKMVETGDGRRAETEEQWEGVWPEPSFTFHCKNNPLECSSERSDRYSEVCQHYGKCTLVRLLRITHIKLSSFAHGHTRVHTGDCRMLNMPPCFGSSWNNSRPVHVGRSFSLHEHFLCKSMGRQRGIKGGLKDLLYHNKAWLANLLIYTPFMDCLCIMNREKWKGWEE